jgi:hypothetical protein
MKNHLSFKLGGILAAAGMLLSVSPAGASNFPGNGNGGFGGAIGNGTLTLTDDGTNINGVLTAGSFGGNALVIYIQSAPGGLSSTALLNDDADALRSAVSGFSGSGRSVMTFAAGFAPNYAIAIQPDSGVNFGGMWQLVNNTNNLPFVTSINLNPTGTDNAGSYTFSFPATAIGLTPGVNTAIKIFGTLIGDSGYRSSEAIAGDDTGSQGWNPFTQTAFATYTFDAGAPVTFPVTFQVDMTAMQANGAFNPGSGDLVEARGSFQTIPFTGGFVLSNSPAHTNIYTGTYNDANAAGTIEQYKFVVAPLGNDATPNYESSDNRKFTAATSPQTLPVVYFGNLAASGAPTQPVTFQVNMSDQIALGRFSDSADYVEVFGGFNQDASFTWIEGNILTNSGVSNIYVGAFPDGNYPGSMEQYKFVIVDKTFDQKTFESIPNRNFTAGNAPQTLPVAFFNNQSNAISVNLQVDMTVQINVGNFHPELGDTVGVQGAFQFPNQWSGGFNLTNSPGNTNVYSGTYVVADNAGTSEQFKYVYNNPGTHYEQVVNPSFGNNRNFAVAAGSTQTLPLVFFSDIDSHDVLSSNTLVTFSVNMTNAVATDSRPFNPATDAVFLNGDFLGWWAWGSNAAPAQYQMTNTGGGSLVYSLQLTVPAGTSLALTYKYSIDGADNEAGVGFNHVRYIRSVGSYVMPLDVFGAQTVEPAVGSLSIQRSGSQVVLSWNGRPGVHLQSTTNPANPVWTDYNNTDGLSTASFPASGVTFYRLVKP